MSLFAFWCLFFVFWFVNNPIAEGGAGQFLIAKKNHTMKRAAPDNYTEEERSQIHKLLERKLGKTELSWREGARGNVVGYLTTEKAAELANDVFGPFGGWSHSVKSIAVDYIEEVPETHTWNAAATAIVRVEARGTFHEDVGYGVAEKLPSRAAALERARKTAASDALKRALRLFGNWLGNSAYSDAHLRQVRAEIDRTAAPPKVPSNPAYPCIHNNPAGAAPRYLHPSDSTLSSATLPP